MVEAAGIEHFVKSNKTIGYKATVPKSCLRNLTADGGLGFKVRFCPVITWGTPVVLAKRVCHSLIMPEPEHGIQ